MEQVSLKNCIINKYKNYFEFCPYIGDNYSEKKILVILESHYCSSKIDPFEFTLVLFNNWKEDRYSMNTTINRLSEVFEGQIDIWKDICFSNYFQKLIISGKSIRELRKDNWDEITEKSKIAFISLIKEIKPKIIFCFSTCAYDNMPRQEDISNEMFTPITSIAIKKLPNNGGFKQSAYTINEREIKVINFTHPLNRRVKWSLQRQKIKLLIDNILREQNL